MKKSSIVLAVSCLLFHACSSSPSTEGEEELLSIVFTGDVLLDRGVRPIVQNRGVDYLFEEVDSVFRSADAVVINLECPLTDSVSPINKKYIFRADARWAQGLRRAGITHAALANNHTNDQSRRGLQATYHHLSAAGITPLGYGQNVKEQSRPIIIKKHKTEVAIFNAVMMPLENWHFLEDKPGVYQPSSAQLVETVLSYHQSHPSTHIVTVLHWGVEFQTSPTMSQRTLAKQLSDAGADVVIGHHPHVVQPIDTIGTTFVFYSLGNFVFDQRAPLTRHSMMVKLLIGDGKVCHETFPVKIVGNRPVK